MKRQLSFTLSKALCVSLSMLLGISLWGTWLAKENAPTVNAFLGQQDFVFKNTDGAAIDPIKDVKSENYPWYYKPAHKTLADLKKDTVRVGEQIEQEGAALLYNKTGNYGDANTALPLAKNSKVSFFSTGAIRPHLAGQGSHGVSTYVKGEPFKTAFTEAGYSVNTVLWDKYMELHGDPSGTKEDQTNTYRRDRQSYPNGARPYKLGDIPWDDIYTNQPEVQSSVAEYSDAAIFVFTRQGGEGVDMWPGVFAQGTDQENVDMLKLTARERSVLEGLTTLKKDGVIKRIIFLIDSTNYPGMEFLNSDKIDVDAVVWTGALGESGIKAVPKLLDGTYNFSGSLPFTIYYDNWDNPAVANMYNGTAGERNFNSLMMHYTNLSDFGRQPEEHTTSYVVYKEGIYVDYRYPETRYEDVVTQRANAGNFDYGKTIAYTHGYGLSYTDFALSDLKVTRVPQSNEYKVNVTVTNTGKVAGKKAVQLYAQKAYGKYDIDNQIEKSSVDFVGFAKTGELKPGDKETVTVTVNGRELFASYDANGAKTYVVTPGDYYLAAGDNAHDALNNILAAKGRTTKDGMDYNGDSSLVWNSKVSTLDAWTYSHSDQTGVEITNLFDESDINKYSGRGDNHVTYTTRNDWTGTTSFFRPGEQTYELLKATAQLWEDQVEGFTATEAEKTDTPYPTYGRDYTKDPLKDENGNVILSKNLTLIDLWEDENGNPIPTTDERWDWLMDQMTWDEMAKLTSCGFRHTEAVASIGLPYSFNYNESNGVANASWIATNKGGIEGKALAAAYDDPDKNGMAELWPGNSVITATLNAELAEECGRLWGEEGNWAGMAGLYGPGFNTYRSAYSGRNYEYFGADPYGAGMMGAYVIRGMQSSGMFAVIKHFAFNDMENYRRAASVWIPEQAAREIYLRQFSYPFTVGGALATMCGMGRLGAEPCPSNDSLISGWLYGETGFQGFATTDVMSGSYNNKPSQIKAGASLSDDDKMEGQHSFDPYKPVAGQTLGYGDFAWKMRDAAKHICYAVLHSNAINGYSAGTEIVSVTPPWQYWVAAIDWTLGILLVGSFVFLGFVIYQRTKSEKEAKSWKN